MKFLKKLRNWCPQPKTSGSTSLTRISMPQKRSKLFYAVPAAAALIVAMFLAFWFFTSTATGPGPVILEVNSEKLSYSQGEIVQFQIYVSNQHFWRVPLPHTVAYMIGEDGVTRNMLLLPGHYFPSLSRTLYDTYVWDQKTVGNRTQLPPGNYTLNVSFRGPTNYGAGANCTVEIRLGE